MPKGIYLVGFSGSGKSTIAQLIGERLDWPVYDLDRVIVERSGMTIPIIFKREGEAGFRLRESEALRAGVRCSAVRRGDGRRHLCQGGKPSLHGEQGLDHRFGRPARDSTRANRTASAASRARRDSAIAGCRLSARTGSDRSNTAGSLRMRWQTGLCIPIG